jgi:delta24-sterol reductase
LEFVDKEFGFYPLWLCPLKVETDSPLLSNALPVEAIVNVGVWGYLSTDYDAVVVANRKLEQKVAELGGRKWLYAYAWYSRDEFWRLYDWGWYDQLRRKYRAETLPTVYDKTCRHERQIISAKRGVLFALLGRRGIRVRK